MTAHSRIQNGNVRWEPLDGCEWMEHAACAGMIDSDVFWAEPGQYELQIVPKEVAALCGSCPVKSECLAWAIRNCEFGIWGGTTYSQRKRLAGVIPAESSKQ